MSICEVNFIKFVIKYNSKCYVPFITLKVIYCDPLFSNRSAPLILCCIGYIACTACFQIQDCLGIPMKNPANSPGVYKKDNTAFVPT